VFTSPRWPITFEYPNNWRIAENVEGGYLALQCLDPGFIASGGHSISLSRGVGRGDESVTDDGRRVVEIDAFTSWDQQRWFLGYCEDQRAPSCEETRQSTRRGMRIMEGEAGEHRLYRPVGGYIGQGGGVHRYLFMLSDAWATVASEDYNTGVTERLVESIRPKPRSVR
jgi:hypothetical protein